MDPLQAAPIITRHIPKLYLADVLENSSGCTVEDPACEWWNGFPILTEALVQLYDVNYRSIES